MKKIGLVLMASAMIAAFSLTGCGGNNTSAGSSKTESQATYSFDITLEYRESNKEFADEVTVLLDSKELWKVKKGELHQSVEQVPAGNHTIVIYGADENDKVGETSLNVEKDSSVKITLDNDSVSVDAEG